MKCLVKAKMVQPIMEVARRYSVNPEFVTLAAAYALLLAVRHSKTFPMPALPEVLDVVEGLPVYVRAFLETSLLEHWGEFQQAMGPVDEDSIVDFFSNEATLMLMESRRDCSAHPVIDHLCVGLLDLGKGQRVADLNCGIGKFVRKAWFELWDAAGSDEGISVSAYSRNVDFAAITYILCDVAGIGAKVHAQSIFVSQGELYDRVLLISPFGIETRAINIPMTQAVLSERFKNFPELRRSSADWVFAARAAGMMAPGGRAIVAVPMQALNGTQSQAYREFLVRNQMIEAVVSIPRGFMNRTQFGFALVVMHEGSHEIKFINGGEYVWTTGNGTMLDVPTLLKDYRDLNDYEAVTTQSIDKVYSRDCNLTPDFYLGEELVYNNAQPFGAIAGKITRGAKLPRASWKAAEGDSTSVVKKVAFKHLGDGLVSDELPGLTEVPRGAEDAVLEEGDLLISRMGFPFKVAVVDARAEKLVADENVWIVRMGGNRALAYYLRAYLESERGVKWLSRLSAGAALRTISAKNIEKIPIPNADEETRTTIAGALEKATILVRENRKRLEKSLIAMKHVFDNLNKNGGL